MKNPFGLTERNCRLSDYNFVYNVTKSTILPYVAMHTKPSKKVFDTDFQKFYKNTKILLKGKRRIGFYKITKHKGYIEVNKLFLSKGYQKRGMGSFFMKYVESLGFKKIILEVWDTNPAIKFYKKHGYKVVGKRDYKYLMAKKL